MPDKKERSYKVYLESPDGESNRTMHINADSKDRATRIATRNAEDVAEAEGGEVYEVKSVEAM